MPERASPIMAPLKIKKRVRTPPLLLAPRMAGRAKKQRDANNDSALVLDSALSKVAKVDETHEAAEETESLSGLSSFFGAKAFST